MPRKLPEGLKAHQFKKKDSAKAGASKPKREPAKKRKVTISDTRAHSGPLRVQV